MDVLSILVATGRILRLRFERGRYAATLAGPDGKTTSLGARGRTPTEAFSSLAQQVVEVTGTDTGCRPGARDDEPTERIRFTPTAGTYPATSNERTNPCP